MAEKQGLSFNKRRVKGSDKVGEPKDLKLKSRKLNPVNTTCYVQILGTGMDTQDTSPSVLLFFDNQRFIFNAGEGLQRFCTEHKIKLSKIDHIFLTRVSSETAGGLPGLLLTLAGMGQDGMSVNIWGPSDLNYLLDAMKSFIPNAAMVHTHCFGESIDGENSMLFGPQVNESIDPIVLIDDEVVRISSISLRPINNMELADAICHSNASAKESSVKPGDIAVIYACELPEIKGKFDPAKAAALGLRPGPKYRELQLGNSVLSDHLDIMENIKSVSCIVHMGPASVTKRAEYQKWMKKFGSTQHIMAGHEMKNMEVPILKSSARITSRLKYLCPQLFPALGLRSVNQTNGLCLTSDGSCEDSSSIHCESIPAENLLKFHLRPYSQMGLDRSAIPSPLNTMEVVNELISEIPEIVDASTEISQFWEGNHLICLDDSVDLIEELLINKKSSVLRSNASGQVAAACMSDLSCPDPRQNNIKNHSDIPTCLRNISRDDMEIIFLGTGSSQPSKYRNVSSVFVNLFSRGNLLLDCGEGTLGQLKRRFGVSGADDAVKNLKFIWISHIHADHHAGLVRILALRFQLLKGVPHEPLLVIGPRQLQKFLNAYSRLEYLDMQFLDCRHTSEETINSFLHGQSLGESFYSEHTNKKDDISANQHFDQCNIIQNALDIPGSDVVDTSTVLPVLMKLKAVLSEAGLEVLYSVPVVHCPQAFGLVLKACGRKDGVGKFIPGWKLVYSGDTRPCQALIDASCDATVLIHEATFEDSLQDEAIVRNHSTTTEAIGVGTMAGAYRIILTHFSQRYPKIPVLDVAHTHNTCIAFDLMSINLADLPMLPKVLPYLKVMFRDQMGLEESEEILDGVL
ncbi:tRNAse Z TRZ4, mitochondrial-like isoform X3 [Dioscorea cayenensis subsp. rotundata]|uniref:ribonuclease Z n=1 Tax=Dioscorea cayennensis subsp. rotundata TaxID=55577 RepID=A0AB40CVH3_DIOCR|nr:tRNAse Z TRZ4, mitochondrial-like isoform X3 [Dioscorea cayenensis subsp. rotundata]